MGIRKTRHLNTGTIQLLEELSSSFQMVKASLKTGQNSLDFKIRTVFSDFIRFSNGKKKDVAFNDIYSSRVLFSLVFKTSSIEMPVTGQKQPFEYRTSLVFGSPCMPMYACIRIIIVLYVLRS